MVACSSPAAAAAATAGSCGSLGETTGETVGPSQPLSLDITLTAHSLGEQNGLKHRDFRRYRAYLSRRLARLRQQMDLKQGRYRYAPKPLPDNINDTRYLLVVLLQAERAWAYGMQLKSDNASAAAPSEKLRAHSVRRFSKALVYAKQLEALCKGFAAQTSQSPSAAAADAATPEAAAAADGAAATPAVTSPPAAPEGAGIPLCDGKTCLDASAYRYHMQSVVQQEKEEWAVAAATLQQLQQVYVQLKRLSSTQPELETLYKTKIEALDPLLRLCNFHSGDLRAAAGQQQHAASGISRDTAAAAGAPENSSSSSTGCFAIWRGQPIHPKKEKARAAVAAALANWEDKQLLSIETLRSLAAAAAADMKAAAPALTERDAQGWAEQYGEASARFRGCVEIIHAEMMAEPEEASWLQVQGLCVDMSRSVEVERDALMLLRCLLSLAATDADLRGAREVAKAHEGFRFSNLLLQGLERMQGEETLPDSRRPQIQRWFQVAKDSRATCLATAIACEGTLAEAFVLSRSVSTRQVLLTLQAELRGDPHERIDLLLASIQKVTAVAVGQRECRYLCALLRQTRDLQSPASGGAATAEETEGVLETPAQRRLNSTVGRLLLPSPSAVPCKPHLFDLAISSLSPPDLSAKTAGASRAGLGGLLKSLWRR